MCCIFLEFLIDLKLFLLCFLRDQKFLFDFLFSASWKTEHYHMFLFVIKSLQSCQNHKSCKKAKCFKNVKLHWQTDLDGLNLVIFEYVSGQLAAGPVFFAIAQVVLFDLFGQHFVLQWHFLLVEISEGKGLRTKNREAYRWRGLEMMSISEMSLLLKGIRLERRVKLRNRLNVRQGKVWVKIWARIWRKIEN